MSTLSGSVAAAAKMTLSLSPGLDLAMRSWVRRARGKVEKEMALLPFLVDRSRTAIDIGGNVGAYVYLLRKLARRVVVLEPNPVLVTRLRRSFGTTIDLIEAAASDQTGTASLRIPVEPSLGGLGTLAASNGLAGHATRALDVRTTRIDDLALTDVGFIKIDVEGAEIDVISGALSTLRRCRPTLLVEAEDRHRPDAVAQLRGLLEPIGYSGFMLLDGCMTPIERFSPALHQRVPQQGSLDHGQGLDGYVNNFIFIARA